MEYVNKLAKDAQSSVESLIGTPKLTLYYFDIQGPAEPARLALTIGGIEFTDKRVSFDEMKAMRAAGELKGGARCRSCTSATRRCSRRATRLLLIVQSLLVYIRLIR